MGCVADAVAGVGGVVYAVTGTSGVPVTGGVVDGVAGLGGVVMVWQVWVVWRMLWQV